MDPGEQTTGTRDEHYNLVSVLYHTLHGAETCDIYALDAEASGRTDLYEFFREAQMVQTGLAERAKELLGIRTGVAPGAAGNRSERGTSPDPILEESVAPPEEVPPDAPRTGDVPPRTGDAPPSPSEPPLPSEEPPPRQGP